MNAKHSLCINRGALLALLSILTVFPSAAQTTYERVFRRNLWNDSRNVAGLRGDSTSISFAELYGGAEGGDFRLSSEAPSSWNIGARAASIKHLEKFSMTGGFSFEQREGRDMCGSMFITPGVYPVDVLEFTPGRKTLQSYAFDGGVSVDLGGEWRIGARMDYRSSNLAKRKDLRHTNYRLDMTVAPGFQYIYDGGKSSIGLNYIFSKDSESIVAEQVGTGESSYYAFLDKGLMYGRYEVWSGSGVHLDETGVNGFPCRRTAHGVSLQMGDEDNFVQYSYLHRSTSIGEKQYIWYRSPANVLDIIASGRAQTGRGVSFTRAGVNFEWAKNYETVLDKVTESGVSTVVEYGQNRILTRKTFTLFDECEYLSDHFDLRLRWDRSRVKSRASQMYPYIVNQKMVEWSIMAEPVLRCGQWQWKTLLRFSDGRVKESSSSVSGSSGVQTSLYRLEDYYARDTEYRTSSRLDGGLTLRYTFRRGIYAEVSALGRKAFGISTLPGSTRGEIRVCTGMTF